MNITALEVDGYGVWTGLKLESLRDGLNVFFGPNEAGKTTLMQFVRAVLYGFSPERRRYLPPVHGGRPGGRLDLAGPNGSFTVSRHSAPETEAEELEILAADGARQSEQVLKVLLCNIDEAIFRNVFAVGLQELQELNTLNDTEAAALLYDLSAGLDRVSLVDVMRELRGSRARILDPAAGPCQLIQLLAERKRLRTEIEELHDLTRRYGRIAAERDQVDREAARLEEETGQLAQQCRVVETALSLGDRWRERKSLDEQLAALGPVERMPEGSVERLNGINASLQEHQSRAEQLKRDRQGLRAEAERLKINESLWRQAPRIEALAEQAEWIGTLEERIAELETEISEAEEQLEGLQKRFGLSEGEFPIVSPRSVSALGRPATAMRRATQQVRDSQQQATTGRETAKSLGDQVKATLDARGERDLTEAIERLSGLVALLRRRVQIDERLEQLERHQAELDQQSQDFLDRQLLPGSVLIGLGAMFILGATMALLGIWGFFAPSSLFGSAGWPLVLFGFAAMAGAIVIKVTMERSAARRMANCQDQLKMLDLQARQARQERDSLDEQIPEGSGSIAARLQTAERELAELEELVPLEARRQAAQQEAETAAARATEGENELAASRRRWKEAVAAAGLPSGLSPKQVRELASCAEQAKEIQHRLARRREELQQRVKELESLTARIAQVVKETGLDLEGKPPVEQLHALVEQLAEQESRIARRQALRREAKQLRKKHVRLEAVIDRLANQRRALFEELGVEDEREFRQRAAQYARVESLRQRRESIQREIEAAIAGHCTEDAIREQLEGDAAAGLEARREQLRKRLEACEAQVKQRFEKRGQLNEQLKALAENRTLAAKQLELATIEKRIVEAARRWQVLAVTHRVLEGVRKTYEETRQPETLQEASGYLERMTEGRYVRVWTPLGDDILLVDDGEGNPHGVEVLSRGAREQLFLSLRLALVNSYARRGAQLPVLLDDVLVNFDAQRAKAAAAVLRDFAAEGRQLLVFTCHDHIARLFQSLKVDVCHLPSNAGGQASLTIAAAQPKKSGRRKSRPEEAPYEVVAHLPEEPEVTEAPAAESAADQPESPEVEPFAPWEEEDADPDGAEAA